MTNLGKRKYLLALVPFFIVIILFEVLPLLMAVVKSFMPNEGMGFTLENYKQIFTKELYLRSILNSVWISIVSAVIGIVIAFWGAKAVYNLKGRWACIFRNILNITSNFAGIPLAFAFIILFGYTGVFTQIGQKLNISFLANFNVYSMKGLLMTYIYFQVPLSILLLIPSFEGLKPQWAEAVSLLGGDAKVYWMKVAIPNLMPGILGVFSVTFANALAAYATGYALLTNNAMLLPVRVSEQFVGDLLPNKEFGSALAVVMMILMVIVTTLTSLRQKKRG